MASINSLGAGSGILTSELVDKIIAAERQATDLRLNTKKGQVNATLSAIGSVQSAVSKVQSAVSALRDPNAFTATTSTVNDPSVLSVVTSNTAELGEHTVDVTSLAKAQTLRSKSFSSVTSEVGTGTLTFRFGTASFDNSGAMTGFTADADHAGGSVTINGTNNTLAGVRDAINAAKLGVKARIVDDGGGFRLALSSTDAGAKNSLEITTSVGSTAGLAALAYNTGAQAADTNLTQTVAATDAVATIDGVPVRRTSNAISGVVEGVTFNLAKVSTGPVAVSVTRNLSAATTKVQAFVDAYNGLKTLSDSLTAYDAKEKTAGLLMGDPTLRTVMAQIRRGLTSVISQLPVNSVRSLSEVGLSTDQNSAFKLSFDSFKFAGALTRDPTAVQGLFASTAKVTDPLVELVGAGTRKEGGTFEVKVARLATQATLRGAATPALAGPITIDDSNDTLTVEVDTGVSSSITLAHGSYADGAALASELQQKVNADAGLRADGMTMTATYDSANQRLELRSTRYGSASAIGIRSVDTATTATLGLSVVSSITNKGVNAAGSVNGVQALGIGQTLTVTSAPPSASSGRYFGQQTAGGPFVIDDANKSFTLRVDGVTTSPVVLATGSYANGAAMASELQTKINADPALAALKRVTVGYDEATRTFTMYSGSTGSTSEISVLSAPLGTANVLGLPIAEGLKGHPGSAKPDPVAGAQIKVIGGSTGARGRLNVVRGVFSQLGGVLDDVLGSGGAFEGRVLALNRQLGDIAKESTKYDAHITAMETRLRTQFAQADAAISKLNSTSNYLEQQIASLNKSNN